MRVQDRLVSKSTLEVDSNIEYYRIIDFLNKNLKDKKIMFGLSKTENKMKISIYET